MKKAIFVIVVLLLSSNCFALPMDEYIINRFKENIRESCKVALNLNGEYQNNDYYVNLNQEPIKGYTFKFVKIKFSELNDNKRKYLLEEGIPFNELRKHPIKVAADISKEEIQEIINGHISRPATSKRIINEAELTFVNNSINVTGKINMKKIPGNPFAVFSADEFVSFSSQFTLYLNNSSVNIKIIDGNINDQEMTPEVINMLHNWLNPLLDFSKLDFNCGIKTFKIHNKGLQIGAFLF